MSSIFDLCSLVQVEQVQVRYVLLARLRLKSELRLCSLLLVLLAAWLRWIAGIVFLVIAARTQIFLHFNSLLGARFEQFLQTDHPSADQSRTFLYSLFIFLGCDFIRLAQLIQTKDSEQH